MVIYWILWAMVLCRQHLDERVWKLNWRLPTHLEVLIPLRSAAEEPLREPTGAGLPLSCPGYESFKLVRMFPLVKIYLIVEVCVSFLV